MDRNREARRGVNMAASNGLSRRRHRSSSLRDSPDEDGQLDLQETARLRDRKKERDRDRDRERDRDRDRERERDRLSRSSKRRRSDKFIMHGSNREDGGDDTSEESVNDDEDDEEDDGGGGGNSSMRMLPPNPSTSSLSMLNHHNNHHHHHHHSSNNHNINSNNNQSRKSFPPPGKVFRASLTVTTSTTTTTTTTWKAADEMIGVSVPRKARSASNKRSHEWTSSGGGIGVSGGCGEQIHRQASTSPVRSSVATVLTTPAPASPSSSNASVRKKMKPTGPKLRPPKSSSNKSSSSAQDEIEIEIAEVLYGMMRQPQGPSKQEIVGAADLVSREISNNNNKSTSDAKSRVSSPISNSPSTLPQSSSALPINSSSLTAPMSAIAPKRKRPRPFKCEDENPSMFGVRNCPISSTTKVEMDQSAKTEGSPNLEKNSATAAVENGSITYDLASSQASEPQPVSGKPENNAMLGDSKGLTEESKSVGRDLGVTKEEPQSPKMELTAGLRLDDDRRESVTLSKPNSTPPLIENPREEKFQIDLMAPPPLRSSPERDGDDFVAVDLQSPVVKEVEKEVKIAKADSGVEAEDKKEKTVAEESESRKPAVAEERNIDLHLDLEKIDTDSGTGTGLTGNKPHKHVPKQQQPPPPVPEKTAQSNSLPVPLPLSMASWRGGLPPMGYMAPLQGVVSMDGSAVSSAAIQPPHLLFSQPRPKRCATHCYIARNIHYHQQFTKMNPFWPAAAGSASLYGANAACNLNVVPPTELHGSFPGRGVNTVQEKGPGLAVFPSTTGKDNKNSQPANGMDAAQRKQVLLQQALAPGAPSNMLHAPAFIFPLSQQQAAAAASVRPGSVKSPPAAGSAASSSAPNSASVSATATAGAAAPAMSFNYPNMPGNETQYLAILQNNAYPFPISAHVGAPPAYRGTHPQAMQFFNGPFYSSQMLHPSQLQQQQPLPTQSQQSQQGHQNASISGGFSSSQKHLQNQQQRPHNSGINGSTGTLQGFPAPKNQPQLQLQQRQQQPNQHEMGGEESPSTADSRVSHANMGVYGQNLAMPLHPPNFALMTTTSMGGATSTNEKKPQQQQQQSQQQSSKAGVESLTPQTFAMTFASFNGAATAPGFDISSIAQNPALLQSFPEAVRHSYQIMAAAQAAQQKKNYRGSEEGKSGGNDAPNVEEERKSMAGKPQASVGQSIAFSRQDLTDTSVSAMTANSVIDSSPRSLNLGSVPARTSVSVMPASMVNVGASAAQQQLQRSQQQQQQMIQLHKQRQFAAAAAAAARSKSPAASNGSAYSDHPHSSSVAAKFPNVSVFPQNIVQSSSSPAQSLQWKNPGRTSTSQVTSPALASSTSSSLKNLPQQHGRTQQQISFAANTKSSAAQGGQPPSNNQSASPPMMVGSPTNSSISKTSAGGSPRTTATSASNKGGQALSLSSQQAKNSPSMPSRKSSPVPSILGTPNITTSSSGSKPQMPQQQQEQHQLPKHALQQAQLLFSNAAYMQAQAQHAANATSSATAAGGFFIPRHREQQPQQQLGSLATSSTGMLSLCPLVTHSGTSTSDPAKAVAAASNIKGGGLPAQTLVHSAQFTTTQSSGKSHSLVPPGFQYVHAVPAAVQVKPAEQKQPAGE